MVRAAVVVVHGIGGGTGKDRNEFSLSLESNVKKLISPDVDVLWVEANWEKLNDAVDSVIERVVKDICRRYIKEMEDVTTHQNCAVATTPCARKWFSCVFDFLSKCVLYCLQLKLKLLKQVEKHMPNIIDAAIDLPLYMQEPKGDEIRNVVREAIASASTCADKVILVGHSLGSVIAFDVAAEELKKNIASRLSALVTMGSPLKWVTEIRRAESNGQKDMPRVESIPWINFWDSADPVPERERLDDKIFIGVDNREVKSGKDLIDAHCSYWTNMEIAETIAKMIRGEPR
jgi:hypothetical protein